MMSTLKTVRDCLKAAEQAEADIAALAEFGLAGGRMRISATVDGDPQAEALINQALNAHDQWGYSKMLAMANGYLHEMRRQSLAALAGAQTDIAPKSENKAGVA